MQLQDIQLKIFHRGQDVLQGGIDKDTRPLTVPGQIRRYRTDITAGRLPFLLSGGIGPDDAQRIRAFDVPGCIGIDLNSRFETEPGLKDVEVLKTFIETVRP